MGGREQASLPVWTDMIARTAPHWRPPQSLIPVTIASQLAMLPEMSLARRETVTSPTSEHPKVLGVAVRDVIPQASVDPPSTLLGTIPPVPAASRSTTKDEHTMDGEVSSFTTQKNDHIKKKKQK